MEAPHRMKTILEYYKNRSNSNTLGELSHKSQKKPKTMTFFHFTSCNTPIPVCDGLECKKEKKKTCNEYLVSHHSSNYQSNLTYNLPNSSITVTERALSSSEAADNSSKVEAISSVEEDSSSVVLEVSSIMSPILSTFATI